MKAFFEKYAVMISAAVCVLALAGVWLGIRFSADAGTYELKDVSGDAAVLDDLIVGMELTDAAHTQHLTLDSGELAHTFDYQMPFMSDQYEGYDLDQCYVEHEDADVQVNIESKLESEDESYEAWVSHMTRQTDRVRVFVELGHYTSGHDKHIEVVTDVTVYDEDSPFVFNLASDKYVYKGQVSREGEPLPDEINETPYSDIGTDVLKDQYAWEDIDSSELVAEDENETVYFTPALRPYHGGKSAIYRVDEWNEYGSYALEPSLLDGKHLYYNGLDVPSGQVTPVAVFPADNLKTLRLDVVDGRLCLLLVADGMMTLRVYEMDGTLAGELPIVKMSPQRNVSAVMAVNKSGGKPMLCYRIVDAAANDEAGNERGEGMLFCVELGDTAILRSMIKDRELLLGYAFADGKWVLLDTVRDMPRVEEQHGYFPDKYMLSVADERGGLLYQGEIVTDAMEDRRAWYEMTEPPYNDVYHAMQRGIWSLNVCEKGKQP